MTLDDHLIPVQTFCPKEGFCNLTTGTHKGCSSARCIEDGSLTYNWPSGETDLIAFAVGDDYGIPEKTSVTINSGTFHLS